MLRPAILLVISLAIYFHYISQSAAISILRSKVLRSEDFSDAIQLGSLDTPRKCRASFTTWVHGFNMAEVKLEDIWLKKFFFEESTQPCGGTRNKLKEGDHGIIESPNYPNKYPSGTECQWTLKVEPVYNLRLMKDAGARRFLFPHFASFILGRARRRNPCHSFWLPDIHWPPFGSVRLPLCLTRWEME